MAALTVALVLCFWCPAHAANNSFVVQVSAVSTGIGQMAGSVLSVIGPANARESLSTQLERISIRDLPVDKSRDFALIDLLRPSFLWSEMYRKGEAIFALGLKLDIQRACLFTAMSVQLKRREPGCIVANILDVETDFKNVSINCQAIDLPTDCDQSCSMSQDHADGCGISTLLGSIGRDPGFSQAVSHIARLCVGRFTLARHDRILTFDDRVLSVRYSDLEADREQLEQAQNRCDYGEPTRPFTIRELLIFLLLFFSGFGVSLWGWLDMDNKRRHISAARIWCGLFLSGAGNAFLLWSLSL